MAQDEGRPPVVAVVGTDDIPPELAPLHGRAELRPAGSIEALDQVIGDADVVLVWDFRASLLRESWRHAGRVRWVHVAGAGVDAALFPELLASDVPVTNARGVFDRSVAEFVIGAMLVFAKDLLTTLDHQRQHAWRHRESEMLRGRSVLVLGAGGIGREVAGLADALGMEVTAVASTGRPDEELGRIHAIDELAELLPGADYVVVALPLTDRTRGLLGEAEIARMKATARLINVGRGSVIEQEALVHALQAGEIAGAALDVFTEEPLPPDDPLWDLGQVLVSPHMSGDFVGWLDALAGQFIDNFDRWLAGEPLLNLVDKGRGYVPAGER